MAMSFFSAASMTISLFSTVQVFAWIATLWQGRPVLTTSMLFALGFLARLRDRRPERHRHRGDSVRLAAAPTPTSSSRTCTTCWSAPTCSRSSPAFYYWLPKITGRMLTSGSARGASG